MCMHSHGYKGFLTFLIGVLILVNFFVLKWEWWVFVGALFIIVGVLKMMMPCSHPPVKAAPAPKKKK